VEIIFTFAVYHLQLTAADHYKYRTVGCCKPGTFCNLDVFAAVLGFS